MTSTSLRKKMYETLESPRIIRRQQNNENNVDTLYLNGPVLFS